MKRLSLLKNLGILAGTSLSIVPIVLTSTACAVKSYDIDEITYDSYKNITSANDVKRTSINFDKILSGSKKLHNGNYVFVVGTIFDSAVDTFFSGVSSAGPRDRSDYYSPSYYHNSTMVKAFDMIKDDQFKELLSEGIKDFAFYSLIDYFDFKFKDTKGNDLIVCTQIGSIPTPTTTIRPFDTWAGKIKPTKAYNLAHGVEWDEESVKETDYIRTDAAAVAYRAFCKKAVEVYPKNDKRKDTFACADNAANTKMAIFKEGVLVEICELPKNDDTSIKAFAEKLVKNYKVKKDEK